MPHDTATNPEAVNSISVDQAFKNAFRFYGKQHAVAEMQEALIFFSGLIGNVDELTPEARHHLFNLGLISGAFKNIRQNLANE
ncbi:MAG: hypothetical protein ACXWW0_00175 [Bacteroidia bacterium]